MSQKNRTALLVSKSGPIEVQERERTKPQEGQVSIRVHYVATNPVDWKIQKYGIIFSSYPATLGLDVAGEIEEVGPGVDGLKKGDKVWAWITGVLSGGPDYGGFQRYTLARQTEVSLLPEGISLQQGSTLATGLATAASGLYVDLALPLPQSTKRSALTADAPLLYVNGGASAVGAFTVQAARLGGYEVIATASAKNHELVKSYGAATVIDYKDHDLVAKVHAAAKGRKLSLAYDTIAESATVHQTIEILGGEGKLILTQAPASDLQTKVQIFNTHAIDIVQHKEVLQWFTRFTYQALKDGTIIPLVPHLVGNSLDDVQKTLDFHQAGVSAIKPILRVD